jgi:hypothetical protein
MMILYVFCITYFAVSLIFKRFIILNSETLLWAIFCVHFVAEYLNKGEGEVFALLTGKGNLLDSYILAYYDVLHTQSKDDFEEDIVELMIKEGTLL